MEQQTPSEVWVVECRCVARQADLAITQHWVGVGRGNRHRHFRPHSFVCLPRDMVILSQNISQHFQVETALQLSSHFALQDRWDEQNYIILAAEDDSPTKTNTLLTSFLQSHLLKPPWAADQWTDGQKIS